MWDWLRTLWRPEAYHGHGRTEHFFEGWYFKQVAAGGAHALAVIPGLARGRAGADAHAFVQVSDGTADGGHYYRFPVDRFQAARGRLDVRIGTNRFGSQGLSLDLADGPHRLQGELRFGNLVPWPVRPWSPGVMGPYAFAPFMECYHGVLSFDHGVEGALVHDGRRLDFSGGRGYLEKDWGCSMPGAWVWGQTNHFAEPAVSLSASIARVPWRRHWFTGHILGLWRQGRLERFTTYGGSRITRLQRSGEVLWIEAVSRRRALSLEAHVAPGAVLASPQQGEMAGRIRESLRAEVHVELRSRRGGGRLFEGLGRHAGLEVVGDLDELVAGLR